ncbi:MAG: right-handed parallel beta-helix repeat-containing protein [Nocardiopsaceae bacterium]|nr:right-handed parallel beta-helix repeat-containing protein [Nocardiopsaceae bacterium]
MWFRRRRRDRLPEHHHRRGRQRDSRPGGRDLTLADNRIDGAQNYGFQISSSADRLHIHGNRVRDTGNTGLSITGTMTNVFRYGNDLRGATLNDASADPVTTPTDLT